MNFDINITLSENVAKWGFWTRHIFSILFIIFWFSVFFVINPPLILLTPIFVFMVYTIPEPISIRHRYSLYFVVLILYLSNLAILTFNIGAAAAIFYFITQFYFIWKFLMLPNFTHQFITLTFLLLPQFLAVAYGYVL